MPRTAGTHLVRGDFPGIGRDVTVRWPDSKSHRHIQGETCVSGKTPANGLQDSDLRA